MGKKTAVLLLPIFLGSALLFQNCGNVNLHTPPPTTSSSTAPPSTNTPISTAPTCNKPEWKMLYSATHIPAGQSTSNSGVFSNYSGGDIIYFSHGYGDIKKLSISQGAVVSQNNASQLFYNNFNCEYTVKLVFDKKNNRLFMLTICRDLANQQGNQPNIVFEYDATSLELKNKFLSQEIPLNLYNVQQATNGNLYSIPLRYVSATNDNCASLSQYLNGRWQKNANEICGVKGIYSSTITKNDDIYFIDSSLNKIVNLTKGEVYNTASMVSAGYTQQNATMVSDIDAQGNIFIQVSSVNMGSSPSAQWTWMTGYFKFDVQTKTLSEISRITGPNPSAGIFRYLNSGNFLSFKYNSVNSSGVLDWGLNLTTDFSNWSKIFERKTTYGALPSTGYFNAFDMASTTNGEIHLIGLIPEGNPTVMNLKVWSYLCN